MRQACSAAVVFGFLYRLSKTLTTPRHGTPIEVRHSQCSPTLTICTNSAEAGSTKWPFTDGSCRLSIKGNCFLRSIWPAWISVSKSHPFLSKMLLLCSCNSVSFDLGSSVSTWRKVSQIVGPRVSSLITVIWGVGSSPCGPVFFLPFPSWIFFSVSDGGSFLADVNVSLQWTAWLFCFAAVGWLADAHAAPNTSSLFFSCFMPLITVSLGATSLAGFVLLCDAVRRFVAKGQVHGQSTSYDTLRPFSHSPTVFAFSLSFWKRSFTSLFNGACLTWHFFTFFASTPFHDESIFQWFVLLHFVKKSR